MERLNSTKHLPIDINSFGFVVRESRIDGRKVANRCGRDFFYYVLHYFYPAIFSPTSLNPSEIEKLGVFGVPMPSSLIWTGLTFRNIPAIFRERGLALSINSRPIDSYLDFMYAMLFKKPAPFESAMQKVRDAIDAGQVVGIDVAMAMGGLIDHVMFVYGYDEKALYVFDTHQASRLPYEKLTPPGDNRFIMRLPFDAIGQRWTRWNRIWIVKQVGV